VVDMGDDRKVTNVLKVSHFWLLLALKLAGISPRGTLFRNGVINRYPVDT